MPLLARRCQCGHVFHPAHDFGCEACGSLVSASVELEARGVLMAVATVYFHPALATPFAVGRVLLDAGLLVEVRLEGPADGFEIGQRVRAVANDEGGVAALECRFTRAEA